ncbi:MAG: hypothetical protein QOF58_5340 [Pseudonocardiales bacterium]|jgi:hypothetical protein|nr:hypothetical protein [Actinomycetota bacterium]MDT7786921.1 hypothetical protein [Pseudonocardiales bacterium]
MPDEVARFFDPQAEGQVFARDGRLAHDAPLTYMPTEAADRFRADSTSGHYLCALPDCAAKLIAVGPRMRRHHWRHPAGAGDHGPEGVWHLASKQLLATWARTQIPTAEVHLDDKRTANGSQPDVWVRWNTPEPAGDVAFEVQYASLTGRELTQRSERYAAAGIYDQWVFGHAEPHTRRIGAHFMLTSTLQDVLACGRRFVWINPDDRTVATPYVEQPEPIVPQPDELWTADPPVLEYARHPRVTDKLLSVRVDALDDCRLDGNGLHTPSEDWIEQEITARAAQEAALRAGAREAAAWQEEQQRQLARERALLHARHPAASERERDLRPERGQLNTGPTEHDTATTPCPVCRAMPTPRQSWPDWYIPPAWVTEVWRCTGCGLVLGW